MGLQAGAAPPEENPNEAPSEVTETPRRKKKPNYKRSRLTLDESEALADRRKLLLSAGEDKAVDMDFDVNGGAGGISIGNPTVVAFTLVKPGSHLNPKTLL